MSLVRLVLKRGRALPGGGRDAPGEGVTPIRIRGVQQEAEGRGIAVFGHFTSTESPSVISGATFTSLTVTEIVSQSEAVPSLTQTSKA